MLSILIPVFNWDIQELVTELHRQCLECKIAFEILCFDDGSDEEFKALKASLSRLNKVVYKEFRENQGRSRIRNELGKAARFEYLLFMDCDSKVVLDNYIQNYVTHLKAGTLLYGGRVYQNAPPPSEYYFHWFYGKSREQIPCEHRKIKPYHSFMTNNFLIPRNTFLKIRFDERLKQYGHEDTIFGWQLKTEKVPVLHLENPLQHEGLETTGQFLIKTRKGLENLWFLSNKYEQMDTRLLSMFKRLKKLGLQSIAFVLFKSLEKSLIRNFHSEHPNLTLFDFYKLGYFIAISRNAI